MKKTIVSSLTFLLSLSIVSTTLAQGNSPQNNSGNGQAEVARERVDQQNGNQPESPAKGSQRIQEVAARLVSKIEQRQARYQEFSSKVVAKRAELSEAGADVEELDRLIRVAEANLNETQADITQMKANIESLDYSLSVRELVREVVSQVREIRESFRATHQSYVAVVQEIAQQSNN